MVFRALPLALRMKLILSYAVLWIERLAWPVMLFFTLAALFIGVSWAGLWQAMPYQYRAIAVLGSIFALLYAYYRLTRGVWAQLPPQAHEALLRLDSGAPAGNQPLNAWLDLPATPPASPLSRELWHAHKLRAARALAELPLPQAKSPLPQKDGFALRFAALLMLIVAGFSADFERMPRLFSAFEWAAPLPATAAPRLDLWIDPPAYTLRAPLYLKEPQMRVAVPKGSILTLRYSGDSAPQVEASQGLRAIAPLAATEPANKGQSLHEKRFTIEENGSIKFALGQKSFSAPSSEYHFEALPDAPPKVTLHGMRRVEEGKARLAYTLEDDYGIAKIEGIITPAQAGIATPLVLAPSLPLSNSLGENDIALDDESHPWAGARLRIMLRVSDDLGQSASSESREIVIPAKKFEHPLAKAIIEQRRKLALDLGAKRAVEIAFSGLLTAPELFTPNTTHYLALSRIDSKIRYARAPADLLEALEDIWVFANALEGNEALSDAERALNDAQEKLSDALENNAEAAEIQRLTEALRQALDNYLREIIQQAERNRESGVDKNTPEQQAQRSISPKDLQDKLKKIEELTKQGKLEEAKRLLKEMQDTLRNLQNAKRQQNPRARELGEALDDLNKMTREQQQLRDETFQKDKDERQNRREQARRPNQRGQQGKPEQNKPEQGAPDEEQQDGQQGRGKESLNERQQALRERLDALRQRLRRSGTEQGKGLGDAEEAMREAEKNLGQGENGEATQNQQQAIDGMNSAAQGLAQQLQNQQNGEGEGQDSAEGDEGGEGEGQDGGRDGERGSRPRGRAGNNTDPMGRQLPGGRDAQGRVQVPEKGAAQGSINERAARALQELRRRLGEPARPQDERDYFERLLPNAR